jgi:hypothetical protein
MRSASTAKEVHRDGYRRRVSLVANEAVWIGISRCHLGADALPGEPLLQRGRVQGGGAAPATEA